MPPWLLPELDYFLHLYDTGRLHHAILLTGRSGLGKGLLAMVLARALLCQADADDADVEGDVEGDADQIAAQEPEVRPCGKCKSCRLTASANHPDMRLLTANTAERAGSEIVVDAVRALIDFLHLSAQLEGSRVAVIVPCDRLTRSAANSLLKILEEPSAGVFLILATGHPGRVPATVRSRCAVRQVTAPDLDTAQHWLAAQHNLSAAKVRQALVLCGGMPFSAHYMLRHHGMDSLDGLLKQLHHLSAGGDPIKEAETWQDCPKELAEMLIAVIAEILRHKHGGEMLGLLNPSLGSQLADSAPLAALHQAFEQISTHRRHLEQPLQGRLAAEAMFIDVSNALQGRLSKPLNAVIQR